MEFYDVRLIKRAGLAVLLTGTMVFSVMITQPKTNQPSGVNKEIAQQAPVGPRTYTTSDNISSRADKPAKPTSDFSYTVLDGDTLYDLANRYGVSVDDIMAANGLASDKLSLDQKLLIPASGQVKVVKMAAKPKAEVNNATRKVALQPVASRARYSGTIRGDMIAWSKAQNVFAIRDVATVIDVDTGYSFKIKRKGGHNHADCEPLTAADTKVMKKIYGSWSWTRRAIVVVIDDKRIAASMAGMPHGSKSVSGNGFSGHFDVHFFGSMTHGSEYTKSRTPVVDPDHQAAVRKAAGK